MLLWNRRKYKSLVASLFFGRRSLLTITVSSTSLHVGLLHLLEVLNSGVSNTNARRER